MVKQGGGGKRDKSHTVRSPGSVCTLMLRSFSHSHTNHVNPIGDTSDVLIPSVFLAQREYLALLSLASLANAPLQVHMQVDDFISW